MQLFPLLRNLQKRFHPDALAGTRIKISANP